MKKEIKGLIKLRRQTADKPTYNCVNCGCNRYSPCTCKHKKDNQNEKES
jgi:hypothetical protein